MEFETDAHRECYEKVKGFMTEMFGEQYNAADEVPLFFIQEGSAIVSILVAPWQDDEAVVRVLAWVATGAENTPELTKHLLNQNYGMRFGSFAIDDEGDIAFIYTILGTTLDKAELRHAIGAVAFTADKHDDEITQKWGGLRALDTIKQGA